MLAEHLGATAPRRPTPGVSLAGLAKTALALLLGAIAIFLAVFSALTISTAFADEKDTGASVYLTVGGLELAAAAVFGTAALLTLTGARHPRGWLGVAALAFAGSGLPYADLVGAAGYAANAALGVLAAGAALAYLRSAGRHAPSR